MASITRDFAEQFQKEITEAVQAIAAKHGLKYAGSTAGYDVADLKVSLKFKASGTDADREKFAKYAPQFNLKPEHFGAAITAGDEVYTICGIEPSRKRPIIASIDDKRYQFDDAFIRKALGCQYDFEKKVPA